MESSAPQIAKRKRIGDLSLCNFLTACADTEESKIAIQIMSDTVLKMWCGNAVRNKTEDCSEVVRGREMEVVEKCTGHCYGSNRKVSNSMENASD